MPTRQQAAYYSKHSLFNTRLTLFRETEVRRSGMRYPFTLVKIKSKIGAMWHVRFWDETLQKYAYSRTTGILAEGKKEHRREAEEAAKKLYEEFTTANLPQPNP
jgi:hypothetical protein